MAHATDKSSRSFNRLFKTVREAQDSPLALLDDPNQHARARARLLQSVAQVERSKHHSTPRTNLHTNPGTGWRWGIGAGLATAACAFALVLTLPEPVEQAQHAPNTDRVQLEIQFDGAPLDAHRSVLANDAPELLAVSDGTRIELAPHGSLFVDDIRSNGATVVLEQGEVSLAVHHEADTSWRVAAGPWSVYVTGTQFVVVWEPSVEHFRVAVSEGSVRVEGPDGEIAKLRAGDEFRRGQSSTLAVALSNPDAAVGLNNLDGSNGSKLVIARDPDPDLNTNPDPTVVVASKSKPSKHDAWDHYFSNADYQAAWEVLAEVPGGIHGEAERVANAGKLLDLADVARFTKHGTDSRKLLERLRLRFPKSNEAAEAAFALGRIAADVGSQAKAAQWFERYLDERPHGSFEADALGRLMDCYDALGDTAAAKSAAKRYVAGHSSGPHAAKAAKLLVR